MTEWVDVCTEDELPVGARKLAQTDAGNVVVLNIEGALYALEDRCSHDGGELASGVCDGDELICPRHGARFCVRTGEALTPPAFEEIDTFPVRVEAGMVQLDIE